MTDATGPDDPTPVEPTEPTEPTPVDPTPTQPAVAGPDPAATTEPITVLDPTDPAGTAADPAGTEQPGDDGTVRVQRWVVLALATFAVGAIGFALGWIAAPGDGDGGERASVTIETPRDLRDLFGPEGPFGRGRGGQGQDEGRGGQGPGEGRGGQATPRAAGAFLGVVTRAADDPDGARIERVLDDSPAEDADLEIGDVITKVDDEEVDGPEELADAIGEHDPDDEVTITYLRDGETATVRVKLGDRASADLRAPGGPSFDF